jgi:hypothetical protein
MRLRGTHALLGLLLAAGLAFPAAAQVAPPCAAFQRDALGSWNATAPVTIEADNGFLDVIPRHAINMRLARILDGLWR